MAPGRRYGKTEDNGCHLESGAQCFPQLVEDVSVYEAKVVCGNFLSGLAWGQTDDSFPYVFAQLGIVPVLGPESVVEEQLPPAVGNVAWLDMIAALVLTVIGLVVVSIANH